MYGFNKKAKRWKNAVSMIDCPGNNNDNFSIFIDSLYILNYTNTNLPKNFICI